VGSTLWSLVIFAAVTLGLLVVPLLLACWFSSAIWRGRRRLRREFRKGGGAPESRPSLFQNPDQLTLAAPPAPGRGEGNREREGERVKRAALLAPLRARLQATIKQADVALSVRQLLAVAGWLGFALGVAGTLFRGPLLGAAGAAVGAAAPLLIVHWKRKARQEKIRRQLPGAFGLMARVLRAGHSVPQALQAVAESFEGPLAAEVSQCQKKQSLGIRPEVTFNDMAQRTGILEVRLFVSAMLIQQQSGGNLTEVLERLASLVRDRLRLRNQVRTLTAEGRLQGLTLLLLPVVVFGALMVINRKYAQVLLDHPSLLTATAVMMGVGVLWIRKIVHFDF
jgi:tight adherence protein B